MFSNSNVHISGGIFNQVNYIQEPGLERLSKLALISATHESGESFDRPKCHENTRVAVIRRLMDFIRGKINVEEVIMWLYGDAGAGKSAIGQTLAEQCAREKRLLGSFFFSRNDAGRATHIPLIATLAYHAATVVPELRDLVVATLREDPGLLQKKLEIQLAALLINPINMLINRPGFTQDTFPNVIIIDGLDECADPQFQRYILDIFLNGSRMCDLHLKILIASRPEIEIAASFHSEPLKSLSTRLALDSSFKPDEDILLFLEDTFRTIKTTHRLKAFIPNSWPGKKILERLVQESSGQFIYASTVAKYISSPLHHPVERCDVLLGLSPCIMDRDLPFSNLDALYMHIFSSIPAENVEIVLRLFGLLVLEGNGTLRHDFLNPFHKSFSFTRSANIRAVLLLDPGRLELYLGNLVSILHCEMTEMDEIKTMRITHASLGDFLLDQRRSKEFYIDERALMTQMALISLRHLKSSADTNPTATTYSFCNLTHLMSKANLTEIREEILHFSLISTSQWFQTVKEESSFYVFFLSFAVRFMSALKLAPGTEPLISRHLSEFCQCMMWILPTYSPSENIAIIPTILGFPSHHTHGPAYQEDLRLKILPSTRLDFIQAFLPEFTSSSQEYIDQCINLSELCYLTRQNSEILLDFFRDPIQCGEGYTLDATRYAAAAFCCFKCICEPRFYYDLIPTESCQESCIMRLDVAFLYLPLLLERASSSRELVSFIRSGDFQRKYATLSLPSHRFNPVEAVRCTLQATEDYLKRVVNVSMVGRNSTEGSWKGRRAHFKDTMLSLTSGWR